MRNIHRNPWGPLYWAIITEIQQPYCNSRIWKRIMLTFLIHFDKCLMLHSVRESELQIKETCFSPVDNSCSKTLAVFPLLGPRFGTVLSKSLFQWLPSIRFLWAWLVQAVFEQGCCFWVCNDSISESFCWWNRSHLCTSAQAVENSFLRWELTTAVNEDKIGYNRGSNS